jgi:hypothetical protein
VSVSLAVTFDDAELLAFFLGAPESAMSATASRSIAALVAVRTSRGRLDHRAAGQRHCRLSK